MTTFAQALRTAREKRGLGRGALASIIGHDPTSIARWEKGGSLPTGTRARRIMDALPELAPFLGTSVLVQSDGAKAPVLAKRAITPRQKSVLEFIERFALEHGYPPGVREIMTAIGIRSTNGAVDHLKALERKGFIRIDAMKARGIVVVQSCIDRQERIRKLREEIAAKQVLLAELEAEEA